MFDTSLLAKTTAIRPLFLIALFAQQSNMLAIAADQMKVQAQKAQQAMLDSFQRLKEAPKGDFPDLPVYSVRTKFTGGFYSPSKNGVSVCQMNYVSQEDPKNVIDFYKDALSNNGWKLQFAAGPAISARHKDGHLCTVNVMDSKLPSIKSQFTVAYRQLVK